MNENKEPGVEEVNDPEVFEQEPPTYEPHDPTDGEHKSRPKWLVPVVAAGVVVVLIAASFGGWKVYKSRQHESAMANCTQSVKAMQSSVESTQATLNRYREAAGIQADQVMDAKTVDAMHKTIKTASDFKPQVVVCNASMSTSNLHTATDKARRTTDQLKAIDRDYAKASKAVVASRDAKSLEDAKSALTGKKDEAAKLLGDSNGKVADNATRDGLQKAIDQAGQVRSGKAKAYQDAAGALQAAIDQVNASVQAKSQADQQAAAQAQAQATQQAAASSNRGRNSYTPSYRPSNNRGGGGGGYSYAPVQAPGAPSTPQGGGSNWRDRLKGNTTGGNGCNPDGSCGIG